jgi:hypothetical protein
MKFMVTWKIHSEKKHETIKLWSSLTPQQRADAGSGVKILGRWHNVGESTGVAILETDSTAAMALYLLQWNSMMDLDISPVVDDEEAAAVGKKFLG